MNVRIAICSPADSPAVVPLLAAQLREHRIETEEMELVSAINAVLADPRLGFIAAAYKGGECIGAAYLSIIWALEHGGRSGWLEELYVKPPLRNQGAGTLLLHKVLEEARARGCRAVDLEIDSEHEQVRPLYLRNGFCELTRSRLALIL